MNYVLFTEHNAKLNVQIFSIIHRKVIEKS